LRIADSFGRWLAMLLLAAGLGVAARASMPVVVDRTIAVVNGHLVTWSDLDEQMRFEALQNRWPLNDLEAADRKKAFNHLVQDWILRDQMQGLPPASSTEVDAQVASIRSNWHMEHDEAAWQATLKRYGITPAELRRLAENQIEILHFTEFQVRPLVTVTRKQIEEYYETKLVPQVRALGQEPEPLDKLKKQIRDLLAAQQMNQEMDKWLANLRSQSKVQILWDWVQ
jgi:hypothetical protein